MWLEVINKVKVTHQGEGHIKVKVRYLHPFKFYVVCTLCKWVVCIRLKCYLFIYVLWDDISLNMKLDVSYLIAYFYRLQRSCSKVMFSQVSVILFTGEGGQSQGDTPHLG